jgi:PadR family transcriptional regulator AphA
MMKVLFSDLGDRDDLLGAIKEMRAWADRTQAGATTITRDYTTGDEPYPGRAHIVSLTQAYRVGLAQMTRRWADWAEQQVQQWPGTHSGSADRLGAGRTLW